MTSTAVKRRNSKTIDLLPAAVFDYGLCNDWDCGASYVLPKRVSSRGASALPSSIGTGPEALLNLKAQMELRLPRATSLWLLLCIICTATALVSCSVSRAEVIPGNETDRLALLEVKAKMVDPLGILCSWNLSVDVCQWYGVTCGPRHQRVTVLELQSLQLSGTMSPHREPDIPEGAQSPEQQLHLRNSP